MNTKKIKSPIGNKLTCKGWHQEAPFRMLQNNLDNNVYSGLQANFQLSQWRKC